jgi:hypothetical protein
LNTKPAVKSRTLLAIVLTLLVVGAQGLVAEGVVPAVVFGVALGPLLVYVQTGLTMLGLWFARLGAGTPIAPLGERGGC